MRKQFEGIINVDVRDSTPDWEPYLPPQAKEGSPNILWVIVDDTGIAASGHVRRPDRDADAQPHSRHGPAVHPVARHSPLLAHPGLPADRSQRPFERHGLHRRRG
jgi:hypothetical protein